MNTQELKRFEQHAEKTLQEYGLSHWDFAWDNAKKRLGYCCNGIKKISISKAFAKLNTFERMHVTLMHEIAHALTPGHGHDRVWKAKCRELGIPDSRVTSDALSEKTISPAKTSKWIGVCPICRQEHPFYKHPQRAYACRDCYGEHKSKAAFIIKRRK